jgi:hypothetical protein
MNKKQLGLCASILFLGFGCSTVTRPEAVTVGDPGQARMALGSGPALVQISTAGSGEATLYLVDDPGDGSATCPSQNAEGSEAIKNLDDDDYAGDLAVPKGKRVCAVVDSPELIMDWLVEDYSAPVRPVPPSPPTMPPPDSGPHAVLLVSK